MRMDHTARTAAMALFAACLIHAGSAEAQVHYDQGRRMIQGIQLLQDSRDSLAYYYVPRFPRLATKDDGTFELLALKYVGKNGESSGGLLHALFEFGLPADMVDSVQAGLQREVPGARLVGPVPLLQATEDGGDGVGSFQVISSVLREEAEGGMARTVLTSGRAPLMPGSRAVVAAMLEPEGATLLWNSLTGPTSDVSVSVHAYYEAVVEGYNARVEANIDQLYVHFDSVRNRQGLPSDGGDIERQGGSRTGVAAAAAAGSVVAGPGGAAIAAGMASGGRRSLDPGLFSRSFVTAVVDSLIRTGGIQVTVLDRTEALDIDSGDMDGILSLIMDQLVELMFDSTSGWASSPPREQAVAYESIQGKTTEGWLSKVFGGRNRQYASDDLYVLKERTDIRRNRFSIVLSRSTTIKVPVDASGNLGGLYDALEADERYFRIVPLDDPAFRFRDLHFQIDGDIVDAFSGLVNFASVTVRKTYEGNPNASRDIVFSLDDIEQGRTIKSVSFPLLGEGDDLNDFEYRAEWSLRGGPILSQPADGSWARPTTAAVPLRPPLEKRTIQVVADREAFERGGINTAVVRFATVLAGKAGKQAEIRLNADDPDPSAVVVIYHDPGEAVVYQVDWYLDDGPVNDELALLESSYLPLEGPASAAAP